jgi:hypothetical protein
LLILIGSVERAEAPAPCNDLHYNPLCRSVRLEQERISQVTLDAARILGNHLPEAFAGYGREERGFPRQLVR